MPKILQHFLSGFFACFVLLSAVFITLASPTPALALINVPQLNKVNYPVGSQPKEFVDACEAEINGIANIYGTVGCDGSTLTGNMLGISTQILGGVPRFDQATGQTSYSPGVVQVTSNYIAYMFDSPPATTQKYLADLFRSAGIGIAQPAYAQGLGFASLDPILESWKTFRNVAYLFFVLIFLVIGFMIMFRRKIGGQTVVTAQQAIPSIITALLTVTFSFAIAGLLIDTMYFIMFMMLSVFGKVESTGSSNLVTMNFLELGFVLVSDSTRPASEAVSTFVESTTSSLGGAISELLGVASNLLVIFIIAIAIVISVFRLFFELLKTYIAIIVSIVLSPILLMFGAIPGKSPFEGWLKGLIGNLSAFPIVLMIVIIFDELTGSISTGGSGISSSLTTDSAGGFLPPYLIGQGNGQAISFLIGFGMILIIPDLVKEGKKMFGATGGVFEQFANALQDSLKKGWTGDHELIPGVAASNLAKSPLTRWMGGVSGKNIAQKTAVTAAATTGGLLASVRGYKRPQYLPQAFQAGVRGGGGRMASLTDEKQLYQDARKEYEASGKKDDKH